MMRREKEYDFNENNRDRFDLISSKITQLPLKEAIDALWQRYHNLLEGVRGKQFVEDAWSFLLEHNKNMAHRYYPSKECEIERAGFIIDNLLDTLRWQISDLIGFCNEINYLLISLGKKDALHCSKKGMLEYYEMN